MSFRKYESGQVTVLTALCLAVLLGFVALAVDVGLLFRSRRNLQIVADAAATAGALDLYKNGGSTSAVTAAENAISGNGLTNAAYSTTCPVTPSGGVPQACISLPPSSGVHTGNGYVEVQVTQPKSATFMSYFGLSNVNVTTRAVAGIVTGQNCIWVNNNLTVQASAGICGIDPNNANAWITSNSKCRSGSTCPANGSVTACGIYAGTSVSSNGNSNCIASRSVVTPGTVSGHLNPTPAVPGAPSQTPPDWMTATPPAPGTPNTCTQPQNLPGATSSTKGNTTIWTATISSGTVSGCYGWDNGAVPANTVLNLTLGGGAGNTVLDNSTIQFNLGDGGSLTIGDGVCNYCSGSNPDTTNNYNGTTLEVYSGALTISTNKNAPNPTNIYAPNQPGTSTNGIAVWEPLSNTNQMNIQWGSATSSFYGYIVAPGASLTMQDQGGRSLVSGLYVGNMTINSELGIMNYNASVSGAPGKNIALVE